VEQNPHYKIYSYYIMENIKDNIKIAIGGNQFYDIKKATQIGMKSNANQPSSYALPIGKQEKK